ncbi:cyclic nucleotide-binding domain-containing protein [Curvibacter sp. APW13]|uniref:cyclic nucleotide-binding domain-containing protein n=1 Tax=Curvibacter sp. APW13 TaxID=3077236 RepID=UPI0028DFD5AE|nr:cyclic nucleotide-binding domain-containing protein [Curvibacter sp. APW13]MDT8990163.1 cyclic nucleotide-binding domain-containing protein [Curvibacter sp. APW13]
MQYRDTASATTRLPQAWADQGAEVWERAVELLVAAQSRFGLEAGQAAIVLSYMHPFAIEEGVEFIQQGDTSNCDFMAFIVDGDVTVETITVSRTQPMTVTVLGPGSIHGELALFDGAPRSASCTACTPVLAAILTRAGLGRLLQEHPAICARFTMALAAGIGQRLRDNTDKLKRYAMMARAMQEEIERLTPDR